MAKFIRRLVNIGMAKESARGTGVSPAFWLPHTALSFEDKSEKVASSENLGVIDDASDGFLVKRWGEGDIEGEIRTKTFGLLLYSLMGAVSSAAYETSAYAHTFTLAQSNQHQSLSLLVDDPIGAAVAADLLFPLTMINSMSIEIEVGAIAKFTVNFMSRQSEEWTVQTPSFDSNENKFIATHAKLYHAANYAALPGTAVDIKRVTLNISKNLVMDDKLGSIDPEDILNQQFSVDGEIEMNYEDRTTFRSYALAGGYRAVRLDFVNTGQTIGSAGNPGLQINLPRVYFYEFDNSSANNEIAKQTVRFKGLYDLANSKNAIHDIVLKNTQASY